MIWHVAVELNEIAALGRAYAWPRPEPCLGCGRFKVWGHGFVERYFEELDGPVPLRCYRCPGCGCVVTPRPVGLFRRVRSAAACVRFHLAHRLDTGRWSAPTARDTSRMRHWLTNLRRQALAWFGWTQEPGLLAAFDRLAGMGVVPIGRAIQRGNGGSRRLPQ